MALPTIIINNSTGSNTAASGAGPSTAVTGSSATFTNGSTSVSITDAVALGGVAVDGSAVLYATTTGSRKFTKITAISGSSGAWTVTVEDSVWSAGTFAWAIGGKRQDFSTTNTNTLQAFLDFHGGWTFDIQGTTYTLTQKVVIAASDVASSAQVTITSTNAAASAPTLTTSSNSISILSIEPTVTSNGNLLISNLNFTNTASTKASLLITGSNNIASNSLVLQDCLFDMNATTGSVSAIDFSARPPVILTLTHNTVRNFTGWGINGAGNIIYGNLFLGSTGCSGGIQLPNDSGFSLKCSKNSFSNCTIGISDTDTSHQANLYFDSNSFKGGTTGISIAKASASNLSLVFWNNAFYSMTTGISISTSNTTVQYATSCGAYGNSFGSVTTTITASTVLIYAAGPTITADPWPSASSGDFRAATGSVLQSAGYPVTPVGYASITNGDDIGSMGHASAGGGSSTPNVGIRSGGRL